MVEGCCCAARTRALRFPHRRRLTTRSQRYRMTNRLAQERIGQMEYGTGFALQQAAEKRGPTENSEVRT